MQEVKKRFIEDVKNHEMVILKDDGLYRHIRFKNPDTIDYYFDLITWPNHLVITGDMGDYHFCSNEDMFDFFIINKKDFNNDNVIEPGYWSEKILPRMNYKEFSYNLYEEKVKNIFNETVEEHELSDEDSEVLWDSIREEILYDESISDEEAFRNLFEFKNDYKMFDDSWEYDFDEFKFHYLWCCYAIVWGILQYKKQIRIKGCVLETYCNQDKIEVALYLDKKVNFNFPVDIFENSDFIKYGQEIYFIFDEEKQEAKITTREDKTEPSSIKLEMLSVLENL